MAGFPFGGGHHQQRGDGAIPPSDQGFFLYSGRGESSSEEAGYTRGFELYQIQREPGQLYSSAAGYADELAVAAARAPMRVAGGVSCQDCGNQAKKDCVHLRCRTCCKSRGYPCPTHVKSTWVAAAKRRERQEQLAATAAAAAAAGDQAQHRRGGETSGGTESSKRPRELVMGCTRIATTTSSTYGGTLDREGLPPEVSAEAMFRCVRVSPVDEADDEFAYQTTVSIGGHVFKGILYDHGADTDHPSSSSTSHLHALPHSSDNARAAAEAAAAVSSAAPSDMLEPYPTPLSAFMAGTQFYPHQHRP